MSTSLVLPSSSPSPGVQPEAEGSQKITFRPTPWCRHYVMLMGHYLAEGKAVPSITQIAQEVGVARETVSRMIQREDFQAWYSQELERRFHLGPVDTMVMRRIAGQALKNRRIEWARLYAEIRGWIGRRESSSRVGQGRENPEVVFINVPQPDVPESEVVQAKVINGEIVLPDLS